MRRDEILAHLTELGRLLDDDGLTGEMYVVGGAAIALLLDARRSTRDIDAVFEPKQAIYDAAARVAAAGDLPGGWLNDAVKGYLAGPDEASAIVLEVPGLRVATASPRLLLAMKVLAHRTGEDEGDVLLLAAELRLASAADVLDLAADVYGDRLEPAARFFVEQLFESAASAPDPADP